MVIVSIWPFRATSSTAMLSARIQVSINSILPITLASRLIMMHPTFTLPKLPSLPTMNSWLLGMFLRFQLAQANIIRTKSGFVNIYSLPSFTFLKEIKNITTCIHALVFHPSSQILLISSRQKKDALRMVHIPSFRVYQNWPTANTPLSYVNSVTFSSDGKYLALGNEKGRVLLYGFKAFM